MRETPEIREILIEPGKLKLWVTTQHPQTLCLYFGDLSLRNDYEPIRVPDIFNRVQIAPNGHDLIWPLVPPLDLLPAIDGQQYHLVSVVAMTPFHERYRPILPWLTAHPTRFPAKKVYRSSYNSTIAKALLLPSKTLASIVRAMPAPEELYLCRLLDLVRLIEKVIHDENHSEWLIEPIFRHPANNEHLSLLQCLEQQRPDIIEDFFLKIEVSNFFTNDAPSVCRVK